MWWKTRWHRRVNGLSRSSVIRWKYYWPCNDLPVRNNRYYFFSLLELLRFRPPNLQNRLGVPPVPVIRSVFIVPPTVEFVLLLFSADRKQPSRHTFCIFSLVSMFPVPGLATAFEKHILHTIDSLLCPRGQAMTVVGYWYTFTYTYFTGTRRYVYIFWTAMKMPKNWVKKKNVLKLNAIEFFSREIKNSCRNKKNNWKYVCLRESADILQKKPLIQFTHLNSGLHETSIEMLSIRTEFP